MSGGETLAEHRFRVDLQARIEVRGPPVGLQDSSFDQGVEHRSRPAPRPQEVQTSQRVGVRGEAETEHPLVRTQEAERVRCRKTRPCQAQSAHGHGGPGAHPRHPRRHSPAPQVRHDERNGHKRKQRQVAHGRKRQKSMRGADQTNKRVRTAASEGCRGKGEPHEKVEGLDRERPAKLDRTLQLGDRFLVEGPLRLGEQPKRKERSRESVRVQETRCEHEPEHEGCLPQPPRGVSRSSRAD